MGLKGPKPKFKDVTCPSEDFSLYRIAGKGNATSNGTYKTKSGRARKFICHACGKVFCSRTNTAFYDFEKHQKHRNTYQNYIKDGMESGVNQNTP